MTDTPVVLSGYGPVGQAFVGRPGVAVRAIRASTAQCDVDGSVPPRHDWSPLEPLADTLRRTEAQVLVQAIPSSMALRDHAAAEAITALEQGVHVVTATKSHLLTHWGALEQAARAGGSAIGISGATGAALPAGDLARAGVRGLGCTTIRACPNGTATFVLDRIAAGDTLDAAVIEAQRRGIAEADPTADLSGYDASTKVRLLAALLWGWDPTTTRVRAQAIDAESAQPAVAGMKLRAVAGAGLAEPGVVRVRIEATSPGDPLHALVGPEKAVVFGCPDAGDIVVSGGRSSPVGAALAMLKDVLAITTPRIGYG
jgi:homoserine dehydrogenase